MVSCLQLNVILRVKPRAIPNNTKTKQNDQGKRKHSKVLFLTCNWFPQALTCIYGFPCRAIMNLATSHSKYKLMMQTHGILSGDLPQLYSLVN